MGETEGSISSAIPEQKPVRFSIEGDGKKFFLDEGEVLDSGGKYPGFINFVGEDGKPEKFAGGIFDKGDHWLVERYDVVGGEYLIPKAGGEPEIKPEVGEGILAAPAETPVGGLEDAAAVAETAEAAPQKGLAGYQLIEGKEKDGKLLGRFQAPDGTVWDGIAKLGPQGKVEIMGVKAEAAAAEPVVELPAAGLEEAAAEAETPTEEAEVAAEAVIEPNTEPMVEEEPAAKAETGTRDGTPDEFQKSLERAQTVDEVLGFLQDKLGQLRQEAIDRNPKLKSLFGQRDEMHRELDAINQAGIADRQMPQLESTNPDDINLRQQIIAERSRRQGLIADLRRIEQGYPTVDSQIEQLRKNKAGLPTDSLRQLKLIRVIEKDFDGWRNVANDPMMLDRFKVLSKWRQSIEGKESLNSEEKKKMQEYEWLSAKIPAALAEEEGLRLVKSQSDDYRRDTQPVSDIYKSASAAMRGLIQGKLEGEKSEPVPAPEPPPAAVELPVVETVVEEALEAEIGGQAAEIPVPSVEVEEEAGAVVIEPKTEPMVEAAAAKEEIPDWLKSAETSEAVIASEPVEAPMPEAAAETPEQRFERRKQGFAGALAKLDFARNDTNGTEREQKSRLAEAFNQTIGAAMELMEEGEAARGVIREFFAGALGTSGGRKLTEVGVRSRMDNAGVFQAATPEERKKKLEEVGLWGLLTLLLELGMSFTDNAVGAVVSEVQSATGAGR